MAWCFVEKGNRTGFKVGVIAEKRSMQSGFSLEKMNFNLIKPMAKHLT
jgi:hypothetical protein